jgi:tetraacyldisaccharide 4'-kinase
LWEEFPDHYAYREADLKSFVQHAQEKKADLLLCTAKDLVKITASEIGGFPVWSVQVELQFLGGEAYVLKQLRLV